MSFYGHPFVPVQRGWQQQQQQVRPQQQVQVHQHPGQQQPQQQQIATHQMSDLEAEERTALAYLRSVQRRRQAAEAAAALEARQRAAAAAQREAALRAAAEQQARAVAAARRERAIQQALARERQREAALAQALEQRRRDAIAEAVENERQRQAAAARAYERALLEYRQRCQVAQQERLVAHQAAAVAQAHNAAHAAQAAKSAAAAPPASAPRQQAPGSASVPAAAAPTQQQQEDEDADIAGINSLLGSLFGFNLANEPVTDYAEPQQYQQHQQHQQQASRAVESAATAAAPAAAAPATTQSTALKTTTDDQDDAQEFPADLNALLNAFLGLNVEPATDADVPTAGKVVGSAVDNLNEYLARWGLEFVPDDETDTTDLRAAENLAKAQGLAQNIATHERQQAARRNPALGETENLAAAVGAAEDIKTEEDRATAARTHDVREAEKLAKATALAQKIEAQDARDAAQRNPALGATERMATAVETARDLRAHERAAAAAAPVPAERLADLRETEKMAEAEGLAEKIEKQDTADAAQRNPALGAAEDLATAYGAAEDIRNEDTAATAHATEDVRAAERMAKAEAIAEKLAAKEQADAAQRNPDLGAAESLATAVETAQDIDRQNLQAHIAEPASEKLERAAEQRSAERAADAELAAVPSARVPGFVPVQGATRGAAAKDASGPPARAAPVVREDYETVHEPKNERDIYIGGPEIDPMPDHSPSFVNAAPLTSTLDSYSNVPPGLRDILASIEGAMNAQEQKAAFNAQGNQLSDMAGAQGGAAPGAGPKKNKKPRRPRRQPAADAEPTDPEAVRSREVATAALDDIDAKLNALQHGFTFPAKLQFGPSTPDRTQPPLLFNRYNTPYHAYAHALLQLILEADGISSNGDRSIRQRRKDTVARVERAIEQLEAQRDARWLEVSSRRDRGEDDDDEEAWTGRSLVTTDSEPEYSDEFEVL